MRVIAGSARRLLLVAPDGLDTRPTADKIKETLFNILQMQVPGSVFLDICAGSGAIGIEAISRGAKKAYFIENGREAVSCIQKNLHKTGFEDQAVILRQDAVAALRHIHEKEADLVYLDPPYKSDLARRILVALDAQPYITMDTCIVVETDLQSDFSFLEETGLEIYREKDYRGKRHLFIRRKELLCPAAVFIKAALDRIWRKGIRKQNMKSAIYPGSFDPVTLGHLDIVERAARMFDELIICVLDNRAKTPLFSVDERVRMLQKVCSYIPNVRVDSYYGLMVDYAKEIGCHVSIRGLRAVTDFEYELQLAQTNRMLSNGDLDTIFLTTNTKYSYLNSSGVKEIAAFGGDISKCVTPYVEELVWEKIRLRKEKNA